MVSFDRRYRSVRKGYARERVKRDTEEVVEQELSGRGVREALADDRGIASLIFGQTDPATSTVRRLEAAEPVEPAAEGEAPVAAPEAVPSEASRPASTPPEPRQTEVEQQEDKPTWRTRIYGWFRYVFGPPE